jgi:hypothetical protein
LKIKEIKTCWNETANLSSLSTTMRTSTFSGRENRYVIAIIFTTQGSVWCFKTNNDDNGDSVDHESIDKFKGKIQFTLIKFQGIFNLNPKISKLAIYPLKFQKVAK